MDARFELVMEAENKRVLELIARAKGLSASEVVRRAIATYTEHWLNATPTGAEDERKTDDA
jgi:hypothetical protein